MVSLVSILHDRGMTEAVLGVEFEYLPLGVYNCLQAALPRAEFRDCSEIFRELRLIKTEQEIAYIRKAVQLAQVGIRAASKSVDPDTVAGQIFNVYQRAILEQVAREGLHDVRILTKGIVRVGWEPWVRTSWARRLKPGDQIQFDVGVRYHGYRSDVGRTYVFWEVGAAQRRIHGALLAAHDAALAQMVPGNRIPAVYDAALATARKAGLGSYSRGHFGHSIGLDQGEEPPYLSPTDEHVLAPGMVFALETPFYVDGIGGFQIEDNVLITDSGCEILGDLSREMTTLGV
jgi:Xaa-Pro aminopeptidase